VVFRGSAALAAGLLTRPTLRGSRYQRLLPDVYAPAALTPDLALRSRAAYLWGRGSGVLAGYSAAELLGADCARAGAPAELAWPDAHQRSPAGLIVRQVRLADDERLVRGGLAMTTPLRTAYDLARRCPLVEAVVAADALAGRYGFTGADLAAFAQRYPGARGTLRLADVVGLVEPLAESAMETRLRLVIVHGGLPHPVAQHLVADEHGQIVARVDLAYPESLVAIEYEGADHFTDQQVIRDGRRYTQLADLGWRVFRYFAHDVYRRPDRITSELRRALTARAIPRPRQPVEQRLRLSVVDQLWLP
jgi:hypothetical protein